ncbi:TetR/AcrR family transcriptional regulator [Nitratireductor rhodophyticola]|uniref:TetR/AcrR family transcriptional regulator n=1 Tax=Nitratireductor rhodophyticola TaxID=2854036 RepID=UPI002AC9411A|nr:TetR/AcrR family transcriptional regulator [Nitratireductor rhodophyticola]MEC9244201.1 TetR/AcrR family transcriptional regulator [Pseudomonadota bacterium]WPZ15160.1 TetR/AcrR family transcriptional regulator [Nitratireductor rhodophyticola]
MSNGADKRKHRSRQIILTAAEAVFLKHGYLGASMDEVADQAGVSKQTVYAHFKSKETLFREVVVAMTGGAAETLREDDEEPLDDRPVGDFLIEVATQQLSVVLAPRLMQLRRMVIGEVDRFPDLGAALYENGPAKSIARLARAFAHYKELDQLSTPDPIVAATYFNWILMGAHTNAAMLLGDTALPGGKERRAHAQESVRIFLCAYGTQQNPKEKG